MNAKQQTQKPAVSSVDQDPPCPECRTVCGYNELCATCQQIISQHDFAAKQDPPPAGRWVAEDKLIEAKGREDRP